MRNTFNLCVHNNARTNDNRNILMHQLSTSHCTRDFETLKQSCLLFRMSNPSLLVDRDVIATSNHCCTRISKVRYYSTMKLLSNTIENLIEIIEKVVIFEQSPHLVFSFVTTRSVVGVCIHVRMIFSVK